MAYRSDCDLDFLGEVQNSDLDILVEILSKDRDGEERWTEEISQNERYIEHCPKHSKYWDLIAAEVQCFGGNTFVTICRGEK